MDKMEVKGQINEWKGKLKQKYGQLTDDVGKFWLVADDHDARHVLLSKQAAQAFDVEAMREVRLGLQFDAETLADDLGRL